MPRSAPLRRLALWLALAYGVGLALVAYWPTPIDRGIDPFLMHALWLLHRVGAPFWLGYHLIEFSANVAMFAPLGLLGVLIVGSHRWWWAVIGGFLVSCAIELGQWAFLPQRVASMDDIVANTLGALVGAVLTLVVTAAHRARARTAVSAT